MKFLHFLQEMYHKKKLLCKLELAKVQFLTKKKRNKKSDDLYDADVANNLAAKRRKDKKMYKFDKNIKNSIENLLNKQYSPEQIVGVLKKENTVTMSHEWIYHGQPMLYIYQDKKNGGKLYENLRQKRKNRKKRLLESEKRGVIPNKVMIADRPPEVETRERYGDWEGDTIIGANHQGAILTLVERKSRFTYIEKLDGKTAKCVENAVVNFFKRTGMPCETITFDNGKERCDVSLYKPSRNYKRNWCKNLFRKSIPFLGKRSKRKY
jgi:transposase, IS30 family